VQPRGAHVGAPLQVGFLPDGVELLARDRDRLGFDRRRRELGLDDPRLALLG